MSGCVENSDFHTDAALAACLAELERQRAAGAVISEEHWLELHPHLAEGLRQSFADRRELARILNQGNAVTTLDRESQLELDYIGSYRLQERLGQGGMGVVFRALQQGLNRQVAVKILPQLPQFSQELSTRFRHEAALISRLSHPHIVTIFEVGRDKGYDFFSMELMPGGSLQQSLGANSSDPETIANWLVQAADAVDHAHRHGIIHRDLKPANLLLDDMARVKVADFGLARDVASDTHATMEGAVLGTLTYMSPEQARGNRDAVGVLSDVYSLGATLYALLAGVPPVRWNPLSSLPEPQSTEEPVPLRRHLPWLNKDLETICHKCLESSPSRRYESAAALAADLRRWINHEPIAARPPNVFRRTARWCRGRPKTSLLAVAAMIAVFATLFVQYRLRRAAETTTLRFEAQAIVASREAGWSAAAASRIHDAFVQYRDPRIADELAATLSGVDLSLVASTTDFGGADLDFSADGKQLLLAGASEIANKPVRKARIWDWRTNRVTMTSPQGGIGPVRFSTNGQAVQASIHDDGKAIHCVDVGQGTSLAAIDWPLGEERRVVGSRARLPVALSNDGQYLAACVNDAGTTMLAVIEIETNRSILRVPCNAHSLAFSPDGKLLGTGDEDGRVAVWTVSDGKLAAKFDAGRRVVQSLAFAADYRRRDLPAGTWPVLLAVGDSTGTVSVFDLADGSVRSRLQGGQFDVLALAFHPDGTLLAAASRGEVQLWDVACSRRLVRTQCGNYNTGLGFSNDGCFLAASALDFFRGQHVSVWKLSESRGIASLRGLGAPISRLRFSRNDTSGAPRLIGALSQDWQLGVWEAASGRLRAVIDTPRGMFPDNAAFDFSPSGDRVAFCTGRAAAVWDTRTGERRNTWQLPDGLADLVSFCGDAELIVARAERDETDQPTTSAWPRTFRVRQLLGATPLKPLYEDRGLSARIVDNFVADDGQTILLQVEAAAERPKALHVLARGNGGWQVQHVPALSSTQEIRLDGHAKLLTAQTIAGGDVRALAFSGFQELGRFAKWPSGIDPGRNWWAAFSPGPNLTLGLYRTRQSTPLVRIGANEQVAAMPTPFSSDGHFFALGLMDGQVLVVDLKELTDRLAAMELD